ncbi:hypothetical protein [Burkholderia pseudomallei]|uniref:hypothetical protein n=1 Tax=Burkholderia pseudomallei TaxID=28450 RepID=UPI0015C34DD7|nr:hypothetical protein [Burkholderia pseudomallei]
MAVDDGLEKQGERTGMAADDACGRAVTISEMRTLRERGRRMSRRRAFEARAEIHVRPGPSVLKQALPRGDVRDPGVVEHESARRFRRAAIADDRRHQRRTSRRGRQAAHAACRRRRAPRAVANEPDAGRAPDSRRARRTIPASFRCARACERAEAIRRSPPVAYRPLTRPR